MAAKKAPKGKAAAGKPAVPGAPPGWKPPFPGAAPPITKATAKKMGKKGGGK